MKKEGIRGARIASNISAEEAGKIVGLSTMVYYQKEREPEKFTLKQLKALENAFNPTGKQILVSEITSFFAV